MVRFYSIVICLIGGATTISLGQVPNNVTQTTDWATLYASISLNKKINLLTEANARFAGQFQNMQHELIGGLEYSLSKRFSVIPVGYAIVFNYIYGKQPAAFVNDEHRFWQRVQYKHKIGSVLVGHRLAFEERSIQRHISESGTVVDQGYINDQYRFRYRANAVLPIGRGDKITEFFYFNGWDEICYGWGKYVLHHTPNQNRLFLGVGYQFSKSSSLQAGYLYQWIKKDNGTQYENNMGIMVQFNYAFALLKSPVK